MKRIIIDFLMFYAMIITHVNRITRLFSNKKTNSILIVSAGVLGDSILFVDPLKHIVDCYFLNGVDRIDIVCNRNVRSLYDEFDDNRINIIDIPVKSNNIPFLRSYLRLINKIRKKRYDQVILSHTLAWGAIVALSARSNRYNTFVLRPNISIYKRFGKMFDYAYWASEDGFVGLEYEDFVHGLGFENYKAHRTVIKKECISNYKEKFGKYIVIAPYAGKKIRNLSIDQIDKIIRIVLEFDYAAIISATKEYEEECQRIITRWNNDKVISVAGRTKFEGYIDLIKDAELIIGTDSGTIHVAAALNTKSIALCGWWGGKMLPYEYKEQSEYDPVCIFSMKEYSCKNCMSLVGIEKNNSECYKRIMNGQNRLCLGEICIKEVYHALANFMDNKRKRIDSNQ